MALVIVGVSDLQICESPDDVLVTYALGSCIAVVVYDPVRRIGGMIHYMLPQSTVAPEKARQNPAMFADTGVPLLFHALYGRSCAKRDLVVKLAGGAHLYDDNGTFNIGRRNYVIARQMLWKAGLLIAGEDVGGSTSRTTTLQIATGRVTVHTFEGEAEL